MVRNHLSWRTSRERDTAVFSVRLSVKTFAFTLVRPLGALSMCGLSSGPRGTSPRHRVRSLQDLINTFCLSCNKVKDLHYELGPWFSHCCRNHPLWCIRLGTCVGGFIEHVVGPATLVGLLNRAELTVWLTENHAPWNAIFTMIYWLTRCFTKGMSIICSYE